VRTSSTFLRWAAALALGLTAGCDRGSPAPSGAEAVGGQASASLSILTLMADAPGNVTHGGVRLFEAHSVVAGQSKSFKYRELVFVDANRISLSPIELIAPPMSAGDESLFFLTQKLRERMMFFSRDFGVRDAGLFAANYTLIDTGTASVVAGVACVRLIVAKRVAPDRRYVLDVDPDNGLLLSSREELLDGTLVARTVFESISYQPNLSNVVWNVPLNGEVDLVPGTAEAFTSLGFQPRTPKLLPAGWQQIGLAKVVDPTSDQVWARLTYSDGVEQIFFTVAKGDGPKHEIKFPPPGTPPKHPDRVRKLAVGNWTLLEGDLAQGRVLVLGRAADGVLEDMIQSAFF